MHFDPCRRLLLAILLLSGIDVIQAASSFRPSNYPKITASCNALRRTPIEEQVDIQIIIPTTEYVNINPTAPDTLVMVHGWPSLWSTWSHQILEFQEDYHLIIPDLRGFGESTHPGDPQSSGTIGDMVGDIMCVLDHASVKSAICVGHDWGSSICYEAARSRPDIFTAVVGVAIPYIPSAGPFIPIENFLPVFPALAYQLFLNHQPDAAFAELDKDIRRTARATLRTFSSPPPEDFLKDGESFMKAWDGVEEIPPIPFFSPEEEDYFVEQYAINGFKNTLQFYSTNNRHHHWKFVNSQGNHTISQPVLAVYPTQDPVADWLLAAKILKSNDYLPHLKTEVMPGGHWLHLEFPKQFNEHLRRWLSKTFKDENHDEL